MTAAGTDVASRPYDLSGMRILLTGASGGIGQATARLCASLGAELVLTDRTPAPVLLEALAGNGRNHRFLACDVRSRSAVDDLCAAIGPVDAAILNAGVYPLSQWEEDRWDEDFDLAMQVNVRGPAHFARALLPGMKARGWGRVVNIASAHGLTASPFKSAYVAAKHGVVGLSKTVALEVAGMGITCNAICPGYVLTPLVEAQIPDQMKVHNMDRETVIREVMLDRQPSRQFATVEQIGGTVVYLCSPAADQVTGTTISVDGGWTAM